MVPSDCYPLVMSLDTPTVWLLDKDGERVSGGLLVGVLGQFEGPKAAQVPTDAIYLFQVEADGLWYVKGQELDLGEGKMPLKEINACPTTTLASTLRMTSTKSP